MESTHIIAQSGMSQPANRLPKPFPKINPLARSHIQSRKLKGYLAYFTMAIWDYVLVIMNAKLKLHGYIVVSNLK